MNQEIKGQPNQYEPVASFKNEEQPESPRRDLGLFWRIVVVVLTILGLFLTINQVFLLGLLGKLEFENAYLYSLMALFLSIIFIIYPTHKKGTKKSVPWYDVVLFLMTLIICGYLADIAYDITHKGWDFLPPLHVGIVAIILCLIVLEASRRAAGMEMFCACLLFAFYPTFAGHMPGFLRGIQFPVYNTAVFHALGRASIIGISTDVFGSLLVGFMVFGVVLVISGGGKFFVDLAFALFGTQRGGPAKVAVFASTLFGSISGSAIANVVTIGSITIPMMKKSGYPGYYAAAIEACASTGGTIMPPVMGSVAFLMAAWLGMPYYKVAVAAAIPGILYYLVLFLQVDAYAARENLKGLPKSEIPHLGQVMKNGLPFCLGFATLVFYMFLGRESQAPFIASIIVILAAMVRKSTRLHAKGFFKLFEEAGQTLSMLLGIMAGVGFLIGSFDVTGLGSAFSSEMINLAGGSLVLLLILGALANLILGTGLSITACYIFLAIVLAPALTRVGLNPIAVHLFVIYWAVASNLTPPVAWPAYIAAVIAGAPPNKTAFHAMKLGIVIYLIPFFFVIRPALVLQAPFLEIIEPLAATVIGCALMAGGIAGYLLRFGRLNGYQRVTFFIAGFLLIIPGWQTDLIAVVACLVIFLARLVVKKEAKG
jgi:TRAP transporter 4TM/12TM fusion protein